MKKILIIFAIFLSVTAGITYANQDIEKDSIKASWDKEAEKYENFNYNELTKEFIKDHPNFEDDVSEILKIFKAIDQQSIDALN